MNLSQRLEDSELDGFERRLLEIVLDYGWQVTMIPADADGCAFAFSIGLFETLQHPELIMFGLEPKTMQLVINDIGEKIRAGSSFAPGQVIPDLMEGCVVTFVELPKDQFDEFLGAAQWFYEHLEFPVLQVVYSDRSQRFPWFDSADPRFRERQPVLGIPQVPRLS